MLKLLFIILSPPPPTHTHTQFVITPICFNLSWLFSGCYWTSIKHIIQFVCSSVELTSSTLPEIVCIKYNFNFIAFVLWWELFIDARAWIPSRLCFHLQKNCIIISAFVVTTFDLLYDCCMSCTASHVFVVDLLFMCPGQRGALWIIWPYRVIVNEIHNVKMQYLQNTILYSYRYSFNF
jgi:hypothetical protein